MGLETSHDNAHKFPGRDQLAIRAAANRPVWAQSSVGNEEAIQHWRRIGQVASSEGHETLAVELVRRDELGPGDTAMIHDGNSTEALVAGVRLMGTDARRLADLLIVATNLIRE